MKVVAAHSDLEITNAWMCKDPRNTLNDLMLDRYFAMSVKDPNLPEIESKIAEMVVSEVEVVSTIDSVGIETPIMEGNVPVIMLAVTQEELLNIENGNRLLIHMTKYHRTYMDRQFEKFFSVVINTKSLGYDIANKYPMYNSLYYPLVYHMDRNQTLVCDMPSVIARHYCSLH